MAPIDTTSRTAPTEKRQWARGGARETTSASLERAQTMKCMKVALSECLGAARRTPSFARTENSWKLTQLEGIGYSPDLASISSCPRHGDIHPIPRMDRCLVSRFGIHLPIGLTQV